MIFEYLLEDCLQHHGIKGMRWGIRRYRNGDGSLTSAGKKRYKKRQPSEESVTAKKLRKKKMNELTNKELETLNRRTRLETEYKKLHPNTYKKVLVAAGSIAASMGTVAGLYKKSNELIGIGKKAQNDAIAKIGDMIVSDFNKKPFKI